MFTGIIEQLGKVKSLEKDANNLRLSIEAEFTSELKVDQSVAHNGVCLTIEKIKGSSYEVVAINETLKKSNLSTIKVGEIINLERCMKMDGRLDGHIVQGHVDGKATVKNIKEEAGSWVFEFSLERPSKLIVEKGSICINGVSLTAFSVSDLEFSVAIIPYTYKHTMFNSLEAGQEVNLEFDIVGKYIQRMMKIE